MSRNIFGEAARTALVVPAKRVDSRHVNGQDEKGKPEGNVGRLNAVELGIF
jgi:hypothetical protein